LQQRDANKGYLAIAILIAAVLLPACALGIAVAGRLAAASQQASAECPAQGRTLYRLENCHDASRSDLINLSLKAFLR
jgi:hypothetical protein